MYSNTIIKLDLIIIIIQKYCEKYLKPDKAISDINKSKTIKFVLDQLNDIRKTKDFKVLKSIFTIEKKHKIKDLKDWLNILCVNKPGLFSKHFNLDVEIDMTKGYKTYVNLLSKLENNKTKVDLKEPNKKISILFNLLFYSFKNTKITGGGTKEEELRRRLLQHEIIKLFVRAGTERRLKKIARSAASAARTVRTIGPSGSRGSGSGSRGSGSGSRGSGSRGSGSGSGSRGSGSGSGSRGSGSGSRGLGSGAPAGIDKSVRSKFNWRKLQNVIFDKNKSKNLFLKLLKNASVREQVQNRKILTEILALQVEDLIYKEAFVEHWKTHFERKVPNLMAIVTSFKDDYVGIDKYKNLDDAFFSKVTSFHEDYDGELDLEKLEARMCVFLALLLNLWTYEGNNWVYNLVIQRNLGRPYRRFNNFFENFYTNYLGPHMVKFAEYLKDNGYQHFLEESDYDNYIKNNTEDLGHKYMCSLSLLARYFCNKINKEFFDKNKNKAINVYFGTSPQVANMLFNPPDGKIQPFKIAQSATRDVEVALDFADGNKDRGTGERKIIVYKIQNSDKTIYSAIPLEFFSNFTSELELLLVPERASTPGSIEAEIVRNSRSIYLQNLKETIEKTYIEQLQTLTGKSQDLIDLGNDPVTFIFVGDPGEASLSKTITFIVTAKKFKKNVEKSKVITKNMLLVSLDQLLDLGDLDDLKSLEDWELSGDFFKETGTTDPEVAQQAGSSSTPLDQYTSDTPVDFELGFGQITLKLDQITPDPQQMASGHGAMTSSHVAMTPGHGAMTPGHVAMTPGHGAMTPGHGEMASSHGAMTPGHVAMTPGHVAMTPGHVAMTPGHGEMEFEVDQ